MDSSRAKDWLTQAEDDLRWAQDSLLHGHFAQVCFVCQQVAAKAIKALALFRGATAIRGHSVFKMVKALAINGECEAAARKLDIYYISARYPDAFPAGRPSEFIVKADADEALLLATLIVDKVKREVQ